MNTNKKSEVHVSPIRIGDSGGRRSRLQKYYDVLFALHSETKFKRGGTKKTHLMYKTNLNYPTLNRILDDLVENNLVATNPDTGSGPGKKVCTFHLTEHGLDFLVELERDLRRIKSACLIWLNREII